MGLNNDGSYCWLLNLVKVKKCKKNSNPLQRSFENKRERYRLMKVETDLPIAIAAARLEDFSLINLKKKSKLTNENVNIKLHFVLFSQNGNGQ